MQRHGSKSIVRGMVSSLWRLLRGPPSPPADTSAASAAQQAWWARTHVMTYQPTCAMSRGTLVAVDERGRQQALFSGDDDEEDY